MFGEELKSCGNEGTDLLEEQRVSSSCPGTESFHRKIIEGLQKFSNPLCVHQYRKLTRKLLKLLQLQQLQSATGRTDATIQLCGSSTDALIATQNPRSFRCMTSKFLVLVRPRKSCMNENIFKIGKRKIYVDWYCCQ